MNSLRNLLTPSSSRRHNNDTNPYIGPRTFTRADADRFFGREREARELLALVSSERVVLFYSQSGAGKSSLINARLIPQLEGEGFEVLPVGRVSGRLLPVNGLAKNAGTDVAPAEMNIFAYNLMLSLDQSESNSERFAHLTLSDFLINLNRTGSHYAYTPPGEYPNGTHADAETGSSEQRAETDALPGEKSSVDRTQEIWPRVMIIDQFEEILITNLHAWEQRAEFFDAVHHAMREDPFLYVVLVMREDYVAALDPYAHRLPGNLRTRYYMERMGKDAALQAVRQPAEGAGRPFAEGVAETLVDNLRQMRVEAEHEGENLPEDASEDVSGERYAESQFVEPVQLQVVCYQLWEALSGEPGDQITSDDLMRLARGHNLARFVDHALSNFYEQAIDAVLAEPAVGVSERTLRRWFSSEMITESGTRGFVHQGEETTGGLPNRVVYLLQNRFLIRAESRAGALWYELVHDRFVQPILQANRTWQARHVRPVLNDAEAWLASDRNPDKLYEGRQLQEAMEIVNLNPQESTELEQEFLENSLLAHRRKVARNRLLVAVAGVLLSLLVVLTVWGWTSSAAAQRESLRANAARATVTVVLATSNAAQMQAQDDANALAIEAAERATSEAVAQEALSTVEFLVGELQRAVVTQAAESGPATPVPPSTPTRTGGATDDVGTANAAGDASTPRATPVPPTSTATPVLDTTPMPHSTMSNSIATATAVAAELVSLYARQTATAEWATSEAYSCLVNVDPSFRGRWTLANLGCPEAPAATVWSAWQPFERGSMLWRSDTSVTYVFPDGRGWLQVSSSGTRVVESSRGDPPSDDLLAPTFDFGQIWTTQERIFDSLGWATDVENGFCAVIQDFEDGFLLNSTEGSCHPDLYNMANEPDWTLDSINVFSNNRWSINYRN